MNHESNPLGMPKTKDFTTMMTVTADRLVVFADGSSSFFEALDKIEQKYNNTPIEERRKQTKPAPVEAVKPHSRGMEYQEILSTYGEQVKHLWEEGKTYADLQMIMSMSMTTIKRILMDMGVDTKRRTWDQSYKSKKKVKA